MPTKRTPAEACRTMPELRDQIDALDAEIVALLAERAGYIDRATTLKPALGWPARIPDRIEEVVAKVRGTAETEGLDPDLTEALWRRLIDWSIAREERGMGGS